jgi:hypothetical protein
MIDWLPREDLFPNGVPYVTQQAGGIPLLLYSWGYATPEHGNRLLNFTWENSLDFGGGTLEAQPILDQVYAFYSMLRDRFLAYNGTSYEEDNLNLMTNSYESHITTVDGIERWWAGFAQPWCEAGIPVQICESNAADILQSLQFPCITNSRDNIDDVPNQRFDQNFMNRWHVGFDRVLLSALAIQPFFDNVWTMPTQPGSTWAPAAEQYVELAFVLSALSAGPVGVGDIINNTNRTLVMTSCMSDGRILKASTPSTYLDLVYLPQSTNPIGDVNLGRIFQTISYIPTSPAHRAAAGILAGTIDAPTPAPYASVLAVDIPAPAVVVGPSDFYPSLSPSAVSERSASWAHPGAELGVAGYVATPWNPGFDAVAAACADGAQGSACVTNFGDAQPLSLVTGVPANNQTHYWAYQTLSPVYAACPGFGGAFGGYSLLGELGKIVRVSVVRFLWAQISCGGANSSTPFFEFAVAGAPGEAVDITVLTPSAAGGSASGVVRHVPVVVGPTGLASVTCEGDGSGANPCFFF